MERSTTFWRIDFAFLELGDYTLSLIELLAVIFSLTATYFNRLGWVLVLLGYTANEYWVWRSLGNQLIKKNKTEN